MCHFAMGDSFNGVQRAGLPPHPPQCVHLQGKAFSRPGSPSPRDLPGERRPGGQILGVGTALVGALELAPAVEFPLVHGDAGLVRLGLYLWDRL